MNKKILIIILFFSLFVQVEYFLELAIYDELSHLETGTILIAYGTFVLYNMIHFTTIFYLDIIIINHLERRMPWNSYFIGRMIIEFIIVTIVALIVTLPFTVFINNGLLVPYFNIPSDGVMISIYYNSIYIAAYNTIFVVTYEAIFMYGERKRLQIEWERSQKENVISQFETLKNQVNPHFLFNSMNALTRLIQTDKDKAIRFTKEFSKLFRQMLELKDDLVITLKEELEFTNSYIFLQKIRYGENLQVHIDIDICKLNHFIPLASVQMLIENAIKHNIISTKKPLTISISDEEDYLVIKNNLQLRNEHVSSTRIGLENLANRYRLLSDSKPEFRLNDEYYFARIPILTEEKIQ